MQLNRDYQFLSKISSALYNSEVEKVLDFKAFRDAISDGQIQSKLWLINALKTTSYFEQIKNSSEIRMFIMGGWYGTLGLMFYCEGFRYKITSIDLDPSANMVAANINAFTGLEVKTENMFETDYSSADIIVNTSSEHIGNFDSWLASLPKGKFLILQNNDYFDGKDHVNCFESLESFITTCSDKMKIEFSGTLKAYKYNRFMLMGVTK